MKIPFRGPKKRIRKINSFVTKWHDLQMYCRDKSTWEKALKEADKLLDKALKKRRFKGKSMGERLMNAQRYINDNDDTWAAHNLVKKLSADAPIKLRETDVKEALVGFRQALRDLGALPSPQETNDDK